MSGRMANGLTSRSNVWLAVKLTEPLFSNWMPGVAFLRARFNVSRAAALEVVEAGARNQVANRVASSQQWAPGHVSAVLRHVAATHEADFWVEIRLDRVVLRRERELVVAPGHQEIAGHVVARSPGRVAAQHVRVDFQPLEELEVHVRSVDAVVVVRQRRLAVGHDGADPRGSEEVPFVAADEVVVGRDGRGRGRSDELLGLHHQHADVVARRLSGHARAADDRNLRPGGAQADSPAEERHQVGRRAVEVAVARAEREGAGVLEEEVALLREEQVEARQVHLLLIDFDLGEVGAVGGVERHRRRQAVLGVEPAVEVHCRAQRPGGARLRAAADHERLDLQVASRPDVLEAAQRSRHVRPGCR